jgi:hemolysin D
MVDMMRKWPRERWVPALVRSSPLTSFKVAGASRRMVGLLRIIADEREHREFLPAHLEILDTPSSPYAVACVWTICLLFTSALVWSSIARIDIYAVASGRVQPSGRSKVVQPFETSKVGAILVADGAHVRAGTPLIELDLKDAEAEFDSKRAEVGSLDAQIARRKAAIKAVREKLPRVEPEFGPGLDPAIEAQERAAMQADINQYVAACDSYASQLAENMATQKRFTASIAARQRLQAVLQERAAARTTLVAKSAGTRAAVIDAVQQVEQAAADLAYDEGQLSETQAAAESLRRRLQETTSDTLARQAQALADALEKRATAVQDVAKATLRRDRMHLTSPIDGTVQQLAVTTVGQVVTAGQVLLVVVPSEGPIEVEALLPNKDIGFVVPGQRADVKIDAFPFTRYGKIEGKVLRVSRDAISNRDASAAGDVASAARSQNAGGLTGIPETQNLVYPVTIELQRSSIVSNGKVVPLTPGMTTTVEIHTGRRRVIDYALAPIKETISTAGHER